MEVQVANFPIKEIVGTSANEKDTPNLIILGRKSKHQKVTLVTRITGQMGEERSYFKTNNMGF